jgi:hypothetical protein
MHKINSILRDVEKRMMRLGLDPAYVQRSMQELSEHWEDVKLEGEREGRSALEAEEIAASRMGDPVKLAKMFKERKQQASWVGRHPVIVFGILPLLAILVWWTAFLSVQALTSGVLAWDENKSMPEPPGNGCK